MDLNKIKEQLRDFANERDWDQFHSPKNLTMALAAEAGELLDIFQWLKEEHTKPENLDDKTIDLAKEEIADIFYYLIRLSDKLEIDLESVLQNKMIVTKKKYPIELSKGNSIKYNRR